MATLGCGCAAPFVIGEQERDHWLAAMLIALDESGLDGYVYDRVWSYFEMAADAMRNSE